MPEMTDMADFKSLRQEPAGPDTHKERYRPGKDHQEILQRRLQSIECLLTFPDGRCVCWPERIGTKGMRVPCANMQYGPVGHPKKGH